MALNLRVRNYPRSSVWLTKPRQCPAVAALSIESTGGPLSTKGEGGPDRVKEAKVQRLLEAMERFERAENAFDRLHDLAPRDMPVPPHPVLDERSEAARGLLAIAGVAELSQVAAAYLDWWEAVHNPGSASVRHAREAIAKEMRGEA